MFLTRIARRAAPLGARAVGSGRAQGVGAPSVVAGADLEARIYERAFAQYLRKKAASYAAMNSPPDEALLMRKHKERVIRMWEQLYRMKQLPDLIVCLSHNSDIAREAAAAGIPTISPVGVRQPSDDVTYAIPISEDAPGVKLDMLRVLHEAIRLGADAPRRRRSSASVTHLLHAAGKGGRPGAPLLAARQAWAAANEAAAVERAVLKRTHAGRSPRGGEFAFPAEMRREVFRRNAVAAAVASELEQRLQRQARAQGSPSAEQAGQS